MNKKVILLILLVIVSFPGCATTVKHNTPSGKPEVTINRPYSQAATKWLTEKMDGRGFSLISDTGNRLVFRKQITDAMAVFFVSHAGESAFAYVTYDITGDEKHSRIVANFKLLANPGRFDERTVMADDNSSTSKYQEFLYELEGYMESLGRTSTAYSPGSMPEFIFTYQPGKTVPLKSFTSDPGSDKTLGAVSRYANMRGYFISYSPSATAKYHYYYQVRLENGDELYYRTSKKIDFSASLNSADCIMWLEDFRKNQSVVGSSVVEGGSILVTGFNPITEKLELSNGRTVTREYIEQVKDLVSSLKRNKAKMADILLGYFIDYKPFDGRYKITYDSGYKTGLSLYVNKQSETVWGVLKFRYHADDWLMVERFSVVADGKKFVFPPVRFEQQNSDVIWEIYRPKLQGQYLEMTKAVADSRMSAIRFYGMDGFFDFTIPERQKDDLAKMLEFYFLLKSSS